MLTNVTHTNPLWNALASTGLADQIEMIKLTPSTLGREEMAWVWTALKADYRPTYRKEKAEDGWKRLLAWFKKYGVA